MMCIEVTGIRYNRSAKVLDRIGSVAVGELIRRSMTKLLGRCELRFVHHIL